jgi:hypothetical protein
MVKTKKRKPRFSLFAFYSLHISGSDNVRSGAAYVFDNNVAALDGGMNLACMKSRHNFKHLALGNSTVGAYRETGMYAARNTDRAGNGAHRGNDFVLCVFFASGAGVALRLQRVFVYLKVTSAGADDADHFFHYFASWRLWWRGVRIALLWPVAFVVPPFFSAPTLALGNEDMPLGRALALSRGRVCGGAVLAFWWRLIWRFLLGILTLGVLWLLYDAHHVPATYFALVMQQEAERT